MILRLSFLPWWFHSVVVSTLSQSSPEVDSQRNHMLDDDVNPPLLK